MGAEHILFAILADQIRTHTLKLPSLPDVALRVRDVADDPRSNLNQIAEVVARDPALSLRLVRLANTAHYARATRVNNVHAAVHRIGMRAIRNIAIAMALEQLFMVHNPVVRQYMHKSWHQAVVACCAASALFNNAEPQQRRGLDCDIVTLLALTHNIGMLPILAEAERHDDIFANPTFLERAFRLHGCAIGGAIMAAWEFEPALVAAAALWGDLAQQPEPLPDYVDYLRLGAVHAGYFKGEEAARVLAAARERGLIGELDPFRQPAVMKFFHDMLTAFE